MPERGADQLSVLRCSDCGYLVLPEKSRCPSCWSNLVHNHFVSGVARIFTATTVSLEDRRAWVGLAELVEQPGLRVIAEFAISAEIDITRLMDSEVEFCAYRGEGSVRVPVFRQATQ